MAKAGAGPWRGTGSAARGILETIKTDVEAGLLGRLRSGIAGEVMGDMLALARIIYEGEGDRNAAAVLAAASFEDTMRRLARDQAGVTDRPKLQDVLTTLKDKDVLTGAQFPIAQSYLQFRNKAVHAEWDKIAPESTGAVIEFVEKLLMKHYS
jgi:hypothetical protein